MTNRDIAERLFMSEQTASVHVSRILAKLDVRGRVEAATWHSERASCRCRVPDHMARSSRSRIVW
jgi:DNA-binding NarL/FixJ family response regulator